MYKLNLVPNKYPGKLIVFMGVDGAGKTTLIKELCGFINYKNIKYRVLKMPSDRIRKLDVFRNFHDYKKDDITKTVSPFALTVLVCGDRLISLEQDIIPSLKNGDWVICDRYVFTGIVMSNTPIIRSITESFILPNLTFNVFAEINTIETRIKQRPMEKNSYFDKDEISRQVEIYNQISNINKFTNISTENDIKDCSEIIRIELDKLIREN